MRFKFTNCVWQNSWYWWVTYWVPGLCQALHLHWTPMSLLSRPSHDCLRGRAVEAEVRLLLRLSLSFPCPSLSTRLRGSHSVSRTSFSFRIWLFSFLPSGSLPLPTSGHPPSVPCPPHTPSRLCSLFLVSAFLCLPLLLNSHLLPCLLHLSVCLPCHHHPTQYNKVPTVWVKKEGSESQLQRITTLIIRGQS